MQLPKVKFPRVLISPLAVKSFTAAYFRRNRNLPEKQEKFILSHVARSADTAFGTLYDFSAIRSVEEFQRAIPLQHYESMYPRIERCLRGEKDIIVRGAVQRFATSSGTTGKNKYIPVTRAALKKNHYHAGRDMMMAYAKNNPAGKWRQGNCLAIWGGFSWNPFTGKKNIGYISAIIQKELPFFAKLRKQPKAQISYLADRQNKVEHMIRATRKKNITMMSAQPSWWSAYLEKLVASTGAKSVLDIWPNFELFVRWGMAKDLYDPIFQRLFPSDKVCFYQAYNASEWFFAAQHENNRDDMLLFLNHAIFYEFIPFENYLHKDYSICHTINNVEVGKSYVIVITNNAWLRRYVLGDVIEFTGTEPHTLKITGRTKYHIDVAGECTPLQPIDEAVRETAAHFHGDIKEYTVWPGKMQSASWWFYDLYMERIEKPSCTEQEFSEQFDKLLCEKWTYYYDERFDTHMLQTAAVHFLPEWSFYQRLETRGKLGGQHKIPKISNNRDIIDQIKAMSGI